MKMADLIVFLQLGVLIGMFIFMINNSGANNKNNKVVIDKENEKEVQKLKKLRNIRLTEPLTEKSRPKKFNEIIGQENGIKALKAAICGPNPQHVIIYGPPGVGKTAAARLVLEEAKKVTSSPFNCNSKFIELDATTLRFDERGIADPLIGSVHDPIYQGAGAMGGAGIPQPKPGAVTKAHGGILFIDEIGELHPIQMNKLLKVLEDRAVYLDSSYYSSEDENIPNYIKDMFENGLPADFRLISATTRSPEEITPALRSRCVEIFFRGLMPTEIKEIAKNTSIKVGLNINDEGLDIISKYCTNGREVINLVQLCSGVAINENKTNISNEDIIWVIQNGQYSKIVESFIPKISEIGVVNGLAVYGANIGAVMQIEATAKPVIGRKGIVKVTGIVEDEEITNSQRKIKRKSTAFCSLQNVLTVLNNIFELDTDRFDIHVNFPGGMPVDGPSAGISMAVAIYSAILKIPVKNTVAMTGEISLKGTVKPIGGVNAKVMAAKKAGATSVILPQDNLSDSIEKFEGIEILPVNDIEEVINFALQDSKNTLPKNIKNIYSRINVITAKGTDDI